MNNSLIPALIVTCVVILVLFAGVYGVYVYKPELLGIAPAADSIRIVHPTITDDNLSPVEREAKTLTHQRDSLLKVLTKASDSLAKLKSININALKDIENLKLRYALQEKDVSQHLDSLVKANFTLFALMYDKAGAKEVAKILAELDERDAAFILKTMKPKNAAKVLEEMNPVQAAAIMTLSATQPLK
jgi:flagellar motility protein MotE (MotC chaperone)